VTALDIWFDYLTMYNSSFMTFCMIVSDWQDD
jgi:hypothetical protein